MHRGHEVKVVGPQSAGHPILGIGRVAALVALCIDRDPIRMCIVDVLVAGMRIGACNHVHAKLAASGNDVAEGVHVAEPSASIVERDLGRIEGDNASCAQRMGMSYHPAEGLSAAPLAGEKEDAWAALSKSRPAKQAAVNPDACLIKVRLLVPIRNSSKRAETKACLLSAGGATIAPDRSPSCPRHRRASS